MPFAAEIARTGSVTFFHHTETVFTNWFYPQNSELLHGIAIALTGHDFLSIFLNLGWLGLALLGGWCVGRPFGRPHLTLIAVAIVLATHTLVVREPGTGKNDVVAIALTVAAVAILFNRSSGPKNGFGRIGPGWAVGVAGLAVGLAAGTKVTTLAPAAMITFAVLVAAAHGQRLRTIGIWLGAALAGGGWWYLRNLIASGNPLPQVESIGPLGLPGPERLQEGRPDFSVFHYVTDTGVWSDYFLPGLEQGFGKLWPLMLVLAVGGVIAIIFRGPGRLTRAHGAAALIALLAYLVTPLSAAGPEGHPTAFAINLRFLTPALAMAIVMIPLLPWFSDRRKLRSALAVLLAVLFLVTWSEHPPTSTSGAAFGIFLALLTVALPGGAWLLRGRLPTVRLAAPVVAVLAAGALFIVAGWPLSQGYFDNRYRDFEPAAGLSEPFRWAGDTRDARIGLAGTTAGFKQFGFYGSDLSNRVIYLGRESPAGGFDAIGTCGEFVRTVNAASLDFLVTSPHLSFLDYENPERSPEEAWVEGDPSLEPVVADGPIKVWRVDGRLDPGRCDRLGPGEEYVPGLKAGRGR
ncbi:MAG: glycosyltransferase 87 family protein [Actinomycetota bacterium]|nr:glycosyltransferase 87 family protein [Actinomycetota bacterium]